MDKKTIDKLADWRDCERALIAATEDETITPEVANVMYQAATYLRQAADEAAQAAQAAQPVGVPDHGFFIGGPHASAIVYDLAHIEPVIAALCSVTGDDEDDYTATDLAAPQPPAQPSADADIDTNDRAFVRGVLSECLSDYSAPNFTDRHGTASRLRLAIEIVDAARAAEGDE